MIASSQHQPGVAVRLPGATPWSMIFFRISGLTTPTTASTRMITRKTISHFLYGAANRAMRRTVPLASFLLVTSGSRRKLRIT